MRTRQNKDRASEDSSYDITEEASDDEESEEESVETGESTEEESSEAFRRESTRVVFYARQIVLPYCLQGFKYFHLKLYNLI